MSAASGRYKKDIRKRGWGKIVLGSASLSLSKSFMQGNTNTWPLILVLSSVCRFVPLVEDGLHLGLATVWTVDLEPS